MFVISDFMPSLIGFKLCLMEKSESFEKYQ